MTRTEHLSSVAARLRAIADSAPTWEHRTELLTLAVEYDRLAAVAAAGEGGRIVPAGTA